MGVGDVVAAVADAIVVGLGLGLEVEGRDFCWAGTFRFIFSSASRRSPWKSGWRNVQLYKPDDV